MNFVKTKIKAEDKKNLQTIAFLPHFLAAAGTDTSQKREKKRGISKTGSRWMAISAFYKSFISKFIIRVRVESKECQ